MGKRFAIVIGVAAAGVMALGAQTAAAAPDVVKYDTKLVIFDERGGFFHGDVKSEVRQCMEGRRVVLYKLRSGADRKLGTDRTSGQSRQVSGLRIRARDWAVDVDRAELQPGRFLVYAKVRPKVRDGIVCRADRSANDWLFVGPHQGDGGEGHA